MTTRKDIIMNLQQILAVIADNILEHGTQSERDALVALAYATRATQPGAAAALTDWHGTEIARVRAFAVIHVAVLGADVESQRALATSVARALPVALAA